MKMNSVQQFCIFSSSSERKKSINNITTNKYDQISCEQKVQKIYLTRYLSQNNQFNSNGLARAYLSMCLNIIFR